MIAPETVTKALSAIKRSADYQYFFSQLKSPDWLRPLWDADLFRAPPAPVREGNYISFPPWPESRYLVRMASRAPETVLDICLKMPETENVRVHEDVIEAALAMPSPLAAKLRHKITAWLASPRLLLLPKTLGQLISHFARGGQVSEAIDLARTVLAVFPGDDIVADLPAGTYRSRQDPVARFDTWHYGEILEKYIPDFIAASKEKGLILLCELLDSAVRYRRPSDNTLTEDFSNIWRPAVEHHGQDRYRSLQIASLLVSAVRDAAEQIAKEEPREISEIIRILEANKWPIFRRITLHLIRTFPDAASSEIRKILTDKERFEDECHEYVLLLQAQFLNLTKEDQKTILGWIEKGPDLHGFTDNAKAFTGHDPSEQDIQRYIRSWQLQRLAPLSDAIGDEWKMRYDDLVKEFGPPKNPDRVRSLAGWVGPTSPLDSAALGSMSVEALIHFFQTWDPPKDFHSPTPEGLAREFTPVVASDPQKFAAQANQFQGLDPTYVRSLLSGFRDAARQERIFAWTAVLELCQWVVDQPRESREPASAPLERDPHWGWARKTIAELLKQGFTYGVAEISFDLRESAWKILETLTRDPEPTPEYEEKYGGSNMDPAHISINTTRGEAMHAVVYYAFWVRRNLEMQSRKDQQLSQDFDRMPEVREVLDSHLMTDPSLAVRSVYGHFFPQLLVLDTIWTVNKLFTIFPLENSLSSLFEAAWNTYILFCDPFDKVIDVLEPIYARAIERLDGRANERSDISESERHLAAHLGYYYCRGKLKIDDPSGLLQHFWSNAEAKLRGYLFEYIGRSLATEDQIPQEIIQRFQRLWEFRLTGAKTAPDPVQYKEELASFSWCFGSGKFDDPWAADQLKEVLNLVNKIDFPKFVVERLAVIASNLPRISVECLKLVVDSELDSWEIYGWRTEAKEILTTAMQSGDVSTEKAAIELIHRLGAKGYFEFRELLQQS